MPAYNFKERFAELILSGRKRQTIRRGRKRPTKVGDIVHLYTGIRTKKCRKLGQARCTAVSRIEIHEDHIRAGRCGTRWGPRDVEALARADGFSNATEFFVWFAQRYALPFDAEVIKWGPLEDTP